MPALTSVNIRANGNTAVTPATLTASDTFTVSATSNQSLILENETADDVVVSLAGAAAPATYFSVGIGDVAIQPLSVTVPANSGVSIYLSSLRIKLAGGVTMTGGTGLKATLITY